MRCGHARQRGAVCTTADALPRTDIILRDGQKKKQAPEQIKATMNRLKGQITYDGFDKVDLVIEVRPPARLLGRAPLERTLTGLCPAARGSQAALEDIPLKQKIFAELEQNCNQRCILATNTSTIDIDQVGAKTQAQSRILGLHFFRLGSATPCTHRSRGSWCPWCARSPAHVMPLLEIVRSKRTSPGANSRLRPGAHAQLLTRWAFMQRWSAFASRCASGELKHAAEQPRRHLPSARSINKTGVVVGNCVGFTANRIFFPYSQAAAFLVDRGTSCTLCRTQQRTAPQAWTPTRSTRR